MKTIEPTSTAWVSICLIARNAENTIGPALESLFRQSLFAELERQGRSAEILCLAHGCTDGTAWAAARVLDTQAAHHPHRHVFTSRVITVREAGRSNAWNLLVHRHSAPCARHVIFMDADISFGHLTTLWNLCRALEDDARAQVATGAAVPDFALKTNPTLREHLLLATSRPARSTTPGFTGQLYGLRAATARRIHLPRDLAAGEDRFIEHLVTTDFLAKEPQPEQIVQARNASYIFAAAVSLGDILRNEKRRMIGRTYGHLLLDRALPALSDEDRANLIQTLQGLDEEYPDWLWRLMAEHLQRTRFFWTLFPGSLTGRFHPPTGLTAWEKIFRLPAALTGSVVALAACWLAALELRDDHSGYWLEKRAFQPARAAGTLGLAHRALPS